ncbi:MAG: hypothetical protein PsegKO_22930 [Pseudohongiellaceae bacterium]|jgi:hypothetical protein
MQRPTSLDAMVQTTGTLFGYLQERGRPFTPRPSDVIISPYGKCGTTWLQQTFHTLRTRGDTDYDDISRVVPWIETSPGLGLDLDAEQKANPRGFKSHLAWEDVPKGGRYVVSFRDPRDAAVSLYKFFEGWFFDPGAFTLDEFVSDFYLERPPDQAYWQHLASWWEQRDNPNVLLLTFEGMKSDAGHTIRQLAAFCDIPLDDELLALTLANSSLDFMKVNKAKFDDLLMRELSERICKLPAGSDSSKVREGLVGGHRQLLSDRARSALDDRWQREITQRFGFPDYPAFRNALHSRLA